MSEQFVPASHADVLTLVLLVALLLGLARLLGEVARRFGQPAVAGEILAGVLLGPSILGRIPWVADHVLPTNDTQWHLIEVVALIGAMLLLAVTGLETDLGLIRRRARTAAGVAAGGLVVPLGLGILLAGVFPDDLLGESGDRTVFALFLAVALAVSAIPVLATILLEMRMMRRDVGQTMLAAGMIDDLAGWTLLGVVIALADASGTGAIVTVVVTVVAFVAVTGLLGPRLVGGAVNLVHSRMRSGDRLLTLAIVLIFAWGAFSQALHLEPVIGAFAMGVLLGRVRRMPRDVGRTIERMSLAVFSPIFFGVAGLRVDLGILADGRLALLTLGVVVVAIAGKMIGAYVAGRWLAGADHWSSLAYGAGLTARGAIGIVVATIGLTLGILSPEVFSMIVIMAVVTSLVTPPALTAILRRIQPDREEQERLRREELAEEGLVSKVSRVLVPVRPRLQAGRSLDVKLGLLDRLASKGEMAVTVLSSAAKEERAEADVTVRRIAEGLDPDVDVVTKVVGPMEPTRLVLDESEAGYDLLVMGAPEVSSADDTIFGSSIDEIVRLAGTPTLVVRGSTAEGDWSPRRILVPTDGSVAARQAADLAFTVAGPDTIVTVLHVVSRRPALVGSGGADAVTMHERAEEITSTLRDHGEALGVATEAMIELGPEPEDAICDVARRIGADLVVMGTSVRAGTTRLFLGPRVEAVVGRCSAPVAVLNS